MRLLSTVAAGALLLSACAPFEHGHYAADVGYSNPYGSSPGTPIVAAGYSDPYYDQAVAASGGVYQHSTPVYSEPVHHPVAPVYSEPARPLPIVDAGYVEPQPLPYSPPVVHQEYVPVAQASYPEPVHPLPPPPQYVAAPPPPPQPQYVAAPPPPPPPQHYVDVTPRPHAKPHRYIDTAPYVDQAPHYEPVPYHEPAPYVDHGPGGYHVAQYAPPPPPPLPEPIQVAPVAAPLPIAKPIHSQYVDVSHQPAPIYETAPPVVAATTVSTAEERYEAETVYAPPSVVEAPPVYMQGQPQYAPDPYPQPQFPPAPASFGTPGGFSPTPYPAPPLPPVYGGGFQQPQGFGFPPPPSFGGGGYGGRNCVTTCGPSVF